MSTDISVEGCTKYTRSHLTLLRQVKNFSPNKASLFGPQSLILDHIGKKYMNVSCVNVTARGFSYCSL